MVSGHLMGYNLAFHFLIWQITSQYEIISFFKLGWYFTLINHIDIISQICDCKVKIVCLRIQIKRIRFQNSIYLKILVLFQLIVIVIVIYVQDIARITQEGIKKCYCHGSCRNQAKQSIHTLIRLPHPLEHEHNWVDLYSRQRL